MPYDLSLSNRKDLRTFLSKTLARIVNNKIIVTITHISRNEGITSVIFNVFDEKIFVRLCDQMSDSYFFVGDPIILNTAIADKVYIMSGKISHVELLDYTELIVDITSITDKLNLRCYERFQLSPPLLAQLGENSLLNGHNALVRNISIDGIKFNSPQNIEVSQVLPITIFIDKKNKITCECKILKKSSQDNYYIYGAKVCNISEPNSKVLNDFIDKLKNNYHNNIY